MVTGFRTSGGSNPRPTCWQTSRRHCSFFSIFPRSVTPIYRPVRESLPVHVLGVGRFQDLETRVAGDLILQSVMLSCHELTGTDRQTAFELSAPSPQIFSLMLSCEP